MYLQAELVQGHAEHLRDLERRHRIRALVCVHVERLARLHPPCPPTALPTIGSGDPRVDELRQPVQRVVAVLLGAAAVDDVQDIVDGDRGLGNVGGNDDLAQPSRRPPEDSKLIGGCNRRVERKWQQRALARVPRGEGSMQGGDLGHTWHEDKDRAGFARLIQVVHQRCDCVNVDSLLIHRLDRVVYVLRVGTLIDVGGAGGLALRHGSDRRAHLALGLGRPLPSAQGVTSDHLREAEPIAAATLLCRAPSLRIGRARLDHVSRHCEHILEPKLAHRVGEAGDV